MKPIKNSNPFSATRRGRSDFPALIGKQTAVVPAGSLSPRSLGKDLLADRNCQQDFLRLAAPVPAKFDTRFLVRRHAGKVAVAVLLGRKKGSAAEEIPGYRGSVELLFDFRNDGLGYTQYVFRQGSEVFTREFAPYPETKSTAALPPKPLSYKFLPLGAQNNPYFSLPKIMFVAVFREEDLFAFGGTIGFNVCRHDLESSEFSSWSFAAGNGAPDASSLGKLHRVAPKNPQPQLVPHVSPAKSFRVSVTNDTPMVICNHAYTPQSLDAEMAGLSNLGVARLHWIDFLNFPGFWSMPGWRRNYEKSVKNCGDLLAAACKAARRNGVELIPDFKIFDLSFPARDGTTWKKHRIKREGAVDLLCIPEMMEAQDAFLQMRPDWHRTTKLPIQTLRIFSVASIDSGASVQLSQSSDNRLFDLVRLRKNTVSIKKILRSNLRWSPDGIHPEPGTHACWMIEIRDLRLSNKFLKLEISGCVSALQNRQFAMVEAIGPDGLPNSFVCSDCKPQKGGDQEFDFLGAWPGWNNSNDHAFEFTTLNPASFGIALLDDAVLPGVLEPTHPKTRKIWLGRIEEYLEHDVAGISFRTLCHHRRCHSWLQYAFSPTAIRAFETEHGRPPEATEKDFALMRRVRGAALGDFLAEASARIRAKKKKVVFQVETGGELPADRDSRMALYYDYEKWISSGLFDELHARSIPGHSPWLRGTILPLARKHGVEVHLMTRNHVGGFGHADLLDIQKAAIDAREMGYSGLNFYEAANLYELTEENTFLHRAMAAHCIRQAVQPTLPVGRSS